MNKHIELVKKWIANPDSVSQEESEDNSAAAYHVRKQLTTKQLATPLESGNKEAERVRDNFSAQVDLVNDQLKAQRELLNSRASAIAPSISSTVVDVLLLIMLLFIGLSVMGC